MLRLMFAVIALAWLAPVANAQQYTAEIEAAADVIKDGDTPLIEIRMFGIDTPEKNQLCERSNGSCYACGREATRALSQMLLDKKATYKFTGDVTYGRPVASIFIGGKDVNLEMVRKGWAVVYERYIPQNTLPRYLAVQRKARQAKRGIWQGRFVVPEKWRRGVRLQCEN